MPSLEDKATYNLGVVVQKTGLKPDTLRAWERRYGLPDPARSEGGHRLYSQKDINLVEWLIERQEEGLRIGQAANLWKELQAAGRDPYQEYPLESAEQEEYLPGQDRLYGGDSSSPAGREAEESYAAVRKSWLEAALNFNEQKAERILTEAFSRFPIEGVWEEIVSPALVETGLNWQKDLITVQQEHFLSSLVTRRLDAMIDAVPPPIRDQTILVANPPREQHVFSPLLINLYLRRRGYRVIYLGANVPEEDLDRALQATHPDFIVLTAQTLDTAAALYHTSQSLLDQGVLIGYGGGIFNRLPEIRERVPGFFLGEKLSRAVEEIEKLIPLPLKDMPEGDTVPARCAQLKDHYLAVEHLIADQVVKTGMEADLEVRYLRTANDHLRKGIEASLTFGDLNYLDQDIFWLGELLTSRKIPLPQVSAYLKLYADAVESFLPEEGARLIRWLEEIRERWSQGDLEGRG